MAPAIMARAAISVSEGSKSSGEFTSSSVAASDSNLKKRPLHFFVPLRPMQGCSAARAVACRQGTASVTCQNL